MPRTLREVEETASLPLAMTDSIESSPTVKLPVMPTSAKFELPRTVGTLGSFSFKP